MHASHVGMQPEAIRYLDHGDRLGFWGGHRRGSIRRCWLGRQQGGGSYLLGDFQVLLFAAGSAVKVNNMDSRRTL